MIVQWIIAVSTLLVVAARPRSWAAASAVVLLAALDTAFGGVAPLYGAVRAVAPMVGFLIVAIGVAALAVRAAPRGPRAGSPRGPAEAPGRCSCSSAS
jgi:hypothetical protein